MIRPLAPFTPRPVRQLSPARRTLNAQVIEEVAAELPGSVTPKRRPIRGVGLALTQKLRIAGRLREK